MRLFNKSTTLDKSIFGEVKSVNHNAIGTTNLIFTARYALLSPPHPVCVYDDDHQTGFLPYRMRTE